MLLAVSKRFDVFATVKGGGNTGQADSLKLGISRALLAYEQENTSAEKDDVALEKDGPWKLALRSGGYLTRDSRRVWRKLPGLVKARKKKQFSKR